MGGTGDDRWYSDSDEYGVRKSEGTMVVEEPNSRVTGRDIAGDVPSDVDYIKGIIQLFERISPNSYKLEDLDTMEDVMVGVFARMFHLMLSKQKDYGPENITKAGIRGIVTRSNDKIERLKTLVGDPDKQVTQAKSVILNIPEDATALEMANAIKDISEILAPSASVKGESVEDTLLDLADYGLIGYMLYMGAWGKPMEKDV